jgi:hypothetical protein
MGGTFDDDGDEEDLDRSILNGRGWSVRLSVFLTRVLAGMMDSCVWP